MYLGISSARLQTRTALYFTKKMVIALMKHHRNNHSNHSPSWNFKTSLAIESPPQLNEVMSWVLMEKPIQITYIPNENLCYPLVNVYITMDNYHVLWVNQRTKWQFSIAMLNYQRVTRPKNKPSGLKIKHIDPQHKCRRVSVGHVPISPSVQVRSVCWLHHAIFLVGLE